VRLYIPTHPTHPIIPINQPIFQRKPKSISLFIAGYKSETINKIDDFIDLHHLDIEKFNGIDKFWELWLYRVGISRCPKQ